MAFVTTAQTAPQGAAYTTTTSGVFIPELWSNEIRRFRDQKLVLGAMVKRVSFLGQKGDKIYIPKINRVGVFTKAQETPVTFQAYSSSEFSMIIDRYRESSFMIEDILNIQSKYDLRREYTREAGYAMARDLEYFILGHRASIPAAQRVVVGGGAAPAAGAGLNRAALLAAKVILDKADVPQEGRVLYVSPAQYISLLSITEFVSADFVNGAPTVTGMVGTLFGVPVVMSTILTKNGADVITMGSATLDSPGRTNAAGEYYPTQPTGDEVPLTGVNYDGFYSAMLIQSDWLSLAMQQEPKTESARKTEYLADIVVNSMLYGAKVYREDSAVLITSGETA